MDELIKYGPDLALGFLENVKLSIVGAIAALLLGTILVAMRVSPPRSCARPAPSTSTWYATPR
ncbi:hypothetical protein ACFQQB_38290 [Nonomuraea rubra]|uniref:hypothetical protein n=1 Tax=Nonomuraea rubra TaxID=46180 RepID=UPI0036167C51